MINVTTYDEWSDGLQCIDMQPCLATCTATERMGTTLQGVSRRSVGGLLFGSGTSEWHEWVHT